MMRILVYTVLVLSIVSCTLSTQQEMALNKALSNLIEARNNGDGLSYLNYTHPAVVKHYKKAGDSILIKRFQEVPEQKSRQLFDEDYIYWDKGYIKQVKSTDSIIQAQIEIRLFENGKRLDSVVTLYATSFNDETDWLFTLENDYHTSYFPSAQKLFKK